MTALPAPQPTVEEMRRVAQYMAEVMGLHSAAGKLLARADRIVRPPSKLSEREAQILDDLTKGQSNKMIALSRDITEATVKVHMKSIMRKLQVENRTQAALWAMENGR